MFWLPKLLSYLEIITGKCSNLNHCLIVRKQESTKEKKIPEWQSKDAVLFEPTLNGEWLQRLSTKMYCTTQVIKERNEIQQFWWTSDLSPAT